MTFILTDARTYENISNFFSHDLIPWQQNKNLSFQIPGKKVVSHSISIDDNRVHNSFASRSDSQLWVFTKRNQSCGETTHRSFTMVMLLLTQLCHSPVLFQKSDDCSLPASKLPRPGSHWFFLFPELKSVLNCTLKRAEVFKSFLSTVFEI